MPILRQYRGIVYIKVSDSLKQKDYSVLWTNTNYIHCVITSSNICKSNWRFITERALLPAGNDKYQEEDFVFQMT